MSEKYNIPWLSSFAEQWRESERHGRAPHALMLLGPRGTGKRCAAAWMAARRLGLLDPGAPPTYPLAIPEHADLKWLTQPEDKQSIGIDQIRALVGDLGLTSYEGGSKVAVIEPADTMTTSAANSLLKTLEEPPGDALLILVADRAGRLPATIQSRCQRLNFAAPPVEVSLEWLGRQGASVDWPAALRAAGNAPIAAIEAHDRLAESAAMAGEFAALAERGAAPIAVAARWAKLPPDFVFGWLGQQVQQCILRLCGGAAHPAAGGISDSVLRRIDRRNLFCYLDDINGLRGQPAGSYNVQLTLESLLIDWSRGLPQRDR